MKCSNYFVVCSAFVLAMVAVSPSANAQLGKKLKKALEGLNPKSETAEGAVSGPKALDQNGLRNILPQWNPRKGTIEQFPHVAVTVLKLPPLWGEPAYADQLQHQAVPGCFTLQLRVWADATNSKVVGPFDWCAPRDLEVTPGMLGSSRIVSAGVTKGLITKAQERYQTGLTRTEGPRPPDMIAPDDPQTMKFVVENNREGKAFDLSMDTNSRFGMMFFNLRVGMGQTFEHQDRRVWIVEIRDPSRPEPLVAPGTLSPPLEPTNTRNTGGGAGPGSGDGLQSQLVDSHLACPTNQKVMDRMKTNGYQCINGSLWGPKPAGFEQFGRAVAPEGGAFVVGDIVVPKIANVKLMAEPRGMMRESCVRWRRPTNWLLPERITMAIRMSKDLMGRGG
jgi:hypothetical protein